MTQGETKAGLLGQVLRVFSGVVLFTFGVTGFITNPVEGDATVLFSALLVILIGSGLGITYTAFMNPNEMRVN